MERLPPSAQSLSEARVVRDRRHGEARLLQRLPGPIRSDELKTEIPQASRKLDKALLVRDAEERPPGGNHPYYRVAMGRTQLRFRWTAGLIAVKSRRVTRRPPVAGIGPRLSRFRARFPPTRLA